MEVVVLKSVGDFICELELSTSTKIARTINLLTQFGYHLNMPYSRRVNGRLFELRIRGQQEVRIFYTIYRGQAWLLHAFIKKSQRIPGRELQKANQKLKKFDFI